jgi:hypothetical protein
MPLPDVDHVGPGAGDDLNDAFRPILAEKHPRSMGQAGAECWAEIWDEVGPMLHGVLESAATIWSEDQLMALDRRGFEEDCYFTFSYSPIRSHVGDIEGVLVTVFETTDQVVGERRMSCLRELAEARADARSSAEVIQRAASVLDRFPAEVPFACLYSIDEGRQVQGGAFAGLSRAVPAEAWPVQEVLARRSKARSAAAPSSSSGSLCGPPQWRALSTMVPASVRRRRRQRRPSSPRPSAGRRRTSRPKTPPWLVLSPVVSPAVASWSLTTTPICGATCAVSWPGTLTSRPSAMGKRRWQQSGRSGRTWFSPM